MNKNNIAKVLNNVSLLKGVVCITDFDHELGYRGRYIDDYLAVAVLGELIEKGIIELKFNEPQNDKDKKRVEYLERLLKEDKR